MPVLEPKAIFNPMPYAIILLKMNNAFPDSDIKNFKMLIPALQLPDANGRHVLAAAVRCNSDVIAPSNLKDFPAFYLQQFDVEPQHPDRFIINLIDLNPDQCLKPFGGRFLF